MPPTGDRFITTDGISSLPSLDPSAEKLVTPVNRGFICKAAFFEMGNGYFVLGGVEGGGGE